MARRPHPEMVSFSLRCLRTSSILGDQTATHGDFEVVERVVDGDSLVLQSGEQVPHLNQEH